MKKRISLIIILTLLLTALSIFFVSNLVKHDNKKISTQKVLKPKKTIKIDKTKLDQTDIKELEELKTSKTLDELSKIQEKHKNVMAWVRIPNTKVNDLLVHPNELEYYLTHDINKNYSIYGELMLDPANKSDFSDNFNFIFGHNCDTKQKFSDLVNYFGKNKKEYLEKHPYFQIITKDKYYKFNIIGAEIVNPDFELYPIRKNSAEHDIKYLKDTYKMDVKLDDNVVILTTCLTPTDSSKRRLIFGKLVNTIDLIKKKKILKKEA